MSLQEKIYEKLNKIDELRLLSDRHSSDRPYPDLGLIPTKA